MLNNVFNLHNLWIQDFMFQTSINLTTKYA